MISIIIPCYNCEQFVSRAVESVLSQTYTNWELILVNNNSTDNTQQILENYKKRLPDKVYLFQELKKGAPAARNRGLREAKGTYIQYLDADDELLPNKLKDQVTLMTQSDCDVVVGQARQIFTVSGGQQAVIRQFLPDAWLGLIGSSLGITSANLWRCAKLLEVNGWDESLTSSQEYDLMFRLLQKDNKFDFDKRISTIIYKSDSSVSRSINRTQLERIILNRISLRTRIREYLEGIDQLTLSRAKAIDTYIFDELMNNYYKIPEFVRHNIGNFRMELSFRQRIKYLYYRLKGFFLNYLPL